MSSFDEFAMQRRSILESKKAEIFKLLLPVFHKFPNRKDVNPDVVQAGSQYWTRHFSFGQTSVLQLAFGTKKAEHDVSNCSKHAPLP